MTKESKSEYSLGVLNADTGWLDLSNANDGFGFVIAGTFVGTITLEVSSQQDTVKTRTRTVTTYTTPIVELGGMQIVPGDPMSVPAEAGLLLELSVGTPTITKSPDGLSVTASASAVHLKVTLGGFVDVAELHVAKQPLSALGPTTETGGASGVGTTGATLTGTVVPHASAAQVVFQYGTTTTYGSTVSAGTLPAVGTAKAVAATAGWRVAVFVTAVASLSVDVAAPASAAAMYGSPDRHCESTIPMPVQPSASTRRARAAAAPGRPMPGVHISTAVILVPPFTRR